MGMIEKLAGCFANYTLAQYNSMTMRNAYYRTYGGRGRYAPVAQYASDAIRQWRIDLAGNSGLVGLERFAPPLSGYLQLVNFTCQ